MPWYVVCEPKRKDDVHGIAVSLRHSDDHRAGDALECSRVAFWRRPDSAARHAEPFEKVLQDEIAKAEKAAEVMNRLDIAYEDAQAKAREKARKELAKLFPAAKAGQPEFE